VRFICQGFIWLRRSCSERWALAYSCRSAQTGMQAEGELWRLAWNSHYLTITVPSGDWTRRRTVSLLSGEPALAARTRGSASRPTFSGNYHVGIRWLHQTGAGLYKGDMECSSRSPFTAGPHGWTTELRITASIQTCTLNSLFSGTLATEGLCSTEVMVNFRALH